MEFKKEQIKAAIKEGIPAEDREWNWNEKGWIIRNSRPYRFLLEDLKYGGELDKLFSFSEEEGRKIENEFLSQFIDMTNII